MIAICVLLFFGIIITLCLLKRLRVRKRESELLIRQSTFGSKSSLLMEAPPTTPVITDAPRFVSAENSEPLFLFHTDDGRDDSEGHQTN